MHYKKALATSTMFIALSLLQSAWFAHGAHSQWIKLSLTNNVAAD